uniref:Uncharacterized protein n=1 Tax=Oryza sativa subsp. japonica TaxID=39947 RepID=Q6I643_ORYSJ|nr:hypothetical protein [Oryza sativa Japonica Group]
MDELYVTPSPVHACYCHAPAPACICTRDPLVTTSGATRGLAAAVLHLLPFASLPPDQPMANGCLQGRWRRGFFHRWHRAIGYSTAGAVLALWLEFQWRQETIGQGGGDADGQPMATCRPPTDHATDGDSEGAAQHHNHKLDGAVRACVSRRVGG